MIAFVSHTQALQIHCRRRGTCYTRDIYSSIGAVGVARHKTCVKYGMNGKVVNLDKDRREIKDRGSRLAGLVDDGIMLNYGDGVAHVLCSRVVIDWV